MQTVRRIANEILGVKELKILSKSFDVLDSANFPCPGSVLKIG